MKALFIFLIRAYQKIFYSQRQFASCKYFPHCSEYSIMAIEKHGVAHGTLKGLWRVIRCNPFSKGGLDLP